ncbi:hypothetical protein GCK32_020310 [Trichostrongylus colubriformis]|uniref:MULE transposase domain-containing protein n=1 Tax=Trichostrongylus colubriformis TaxID=6319 RepID=A0AAN8FHU4_TRICO
MLAGGDGVHYLQPDATSGSSQLYTIYGVMANCVDVPLLFAITTRQHSAYGWCRKFLDFIRTTWYEGPFKDMWLKWDLLELRTTNVAESFHRLEHRALSEKPSHRRPPPCPAEFCHYRESSSSQ